MTPRGGGATMSTHPTMPRYRASWPSRTPSPTSRCAGFSVSLFVSIFGVFCILFFLWGVLHLVCSVMVPGCLSRIRIFSIPDPGSEFFPFRISDPNFFHPGSASKYFNPQKWVLSSRKYDTACSSRIPDPWVKRAPDPGSATLFVC